MSSFFSTPTAADKRIEAATSDHIAEAPLATYLEIAEEIKESSDAGQSHLKALRKRLQSKSSHTVFLALQLLDVTVKNGGDAYHESVSQPDFLNLIASIGTTAKEKHVSDAALSLLYQWARAFPAQGLMTYAEVYNKLRNKGVAFPDAAAQSAPVFNPPPNLTINAPSRQVASNRAPDRSPNRSPSRSPRPQEEKEPHERNPLSYASPFYVDKIKTESLQVVEYLTLFQQLIAAEAAPQQLKANESVQSLHSTIADCRSRVTRLLAEIEDETVMDLAIQLNDAICVSLDYYEQRVKGRAVPEPTVVVPTVLRKQGEQKEGKEQSVDNNKQQQQQQGEPGEAPPSYAAPSYGAQAPPAQQQRQQQQQPPSASPLDQFDPLA